MDSCLICKEIIDKRFQISVSDTEASTSVDGHVCRRCWDKFVSSYHNEGLFRITQFAAWIKAKKDVCRW